MARPVGSTWPGRIRADATYRGVRIMKNPDSSGCCALVKLSSIWDHSKHPVWCSWSHRPDSPFCGAHAHLLAICGDVEGFFDGLFETKHARRHGLKFPPEQVEAADKALAELWGAE